MLPRFPEPTTVTVPDPPPPEPQSLPVPLTTPLELAWRHCVPVATSLRVRADSDGAVLKTSNPLPVSFDITPASCAEVVDPKILRLLVTVPGKVNVDGIENVHVPVVVIVHVPVAVICAAVPAITTCVTVPVPAPPAVITAHVPLLQADKCSFV